MRTVAEFVRLNILLPLAEQLKGLRATYWYNQIRKMNREGQGIDQPAYSSRAIMPMN
jgi:hypothetical protein